MTKQIHFGRESVDRMYKGVEELANTVSVTMGPRGRNVVIQKEYGTPLITNDGVTIAREIELEGALENMGAQLVKEAATKTNDAAGDGTTTATVLAHAMIKEGLRLVARGSNPMVVKKGMEKAVASVVEELAIRSKPIRTREEIQQVATISAQDAEVGSLIADIMETVGKDGVITVEGGHTLGLSKKVVEGMQFDTGYISPYMVTDSVRMDSTHENVRVMVTDKRVSTAKDIMPILQQLSETGENKLVIIADDVDGEALNAIIINTVRGAFKVLAIKAPGFGDRRKDILKDVATVVGAELISDDLGLKLEEATIASLGYANKIVSTKDNTTIVGGSGSLDSIGERALMIKAQIDACKSDFDKEKLEERLAKLTGGVGIIEVGAATEAELKEKKLRIEDALSATKAAVSEGIVIGGGTALLKASKVLDTLVCSKEEEVGVKIVQNALSWPLAHIASNSGKNGNTIVDKVLDTDTYEFGYDAANDTYVDMFAAGIVDPTKVTRSALQNAVSVAAMFLTTEAAITTVKKDERGNGLDVGPMF